MFSRLFSSLFRGLFRGLSSVMYIYEKKYKIMNKNIKIFGLTRLVGAVSVAVLMGMGSMSCSKMLNTNPTSEIATSKLYETTEGAMAAMDGLYRSLASIGATTSNFEQAFGIASNQLAMELMADDMVQRESGNGWFYFHYTHQIRDYQFYSAWTPYEIWNQWYATINQTNEIIAYTPGSVGDAGKKNSIMGQAYAMRAFAYFNLVRWYAPTYVGHEQAKGVPIYLTPTTADRKGNPRATVEEVYRVINADLDTAFTYFAEAAPAIHKSHIDQYVAWGFRSRVALVQENWALAAEAASNALGKPGVQLMDGLQLVAGFNSLDNTEWMWGIEMSETQAGSYASLWAHMDARLPMHAQTSRKLISDWLYRKIIASDVRAGWFIDPNSFDNRDESYEPDDPTGPRVRYSQLKYQAPSISSTRGDYLYMRAAEMYLNRAEALCRLGDYAGAREALITIVGPRYDDDFYADFISYLPDGNVMTPISPSNLETTVQNLLDEIMVQRRLELWGEGFRWFDIIRTKAGFSRRYPGSNHPHQLYILNTEDARFVMTIPQAEFDSNQSMDVATDQNPLE